MNGERGRCKSLRRGGGSFQVGERKFEEFEEIEWNLDEREKTSVESEEVA